MTVFDALAFIRQPLEQLAASGARPADARFVPFYDEYRRLLESGVKSSYAVEVAAGHNGISVRHAYTVIARLEKQLNC